MRILGIETSCDETGASLVEDGRRILSNIVLSQERIHAEFGGIVPEVASRQHIRSIIPIIRIALGRANLSLHEIDAVGVTSGPGLAGSLLVGINVAKGIALSLGVPLIGVNHLEAHIYASWLLPEPPYLPAVCLVVSGGHTELILMRDHLDLRVIGRTRDDAAGEAFDKVARILGLGYPGGPHIERVAREGRPTFTLPTPIPHSYDFSFSGLKTWVLRMREKIGEDEIKDLARSFQDKVVEVLLDKTFRAYREFGANSIIVAGGVASNSSLREAFLSLPVPVFIPPPELCTDNGAMIASCSYFHLIKGDLSPLSLDATPSLSIPSLYQ